MLEWKPACSEAEKQPVDLPLWLETQQENISPASQAKNTEKLQVPLYSFLIVSLSVFLASPQSVSNSCQLVAPSSKVDFIKSLGIHTVANIPQCCTFNLWGLPQLYVGAIELRSLMFSWCLERQNFCENTHTVWCQSIMSLDFTLPLKEHIARVIDTFLAMPFPILLGPQLCRTIGSSNGHGGLAAVRAVGCGPGSVL